MLRHARIATLRTRNIEMNGERWRQIDKIFKDLIEQTPEERALFLDRFRADDPLLKKEVEDLIQAYERAGSFLNSPAAVSDSGSLIGRTLGSYESKRCLGPAGWALSTLLKTSRLGATSR